MGSGLYRTIDAAARALLDCDGDCPPVEVAFEAGNSRPLTESELRRLGAAVTEQRATHHKRPRVYADSDLGRLIAILDPALG